MKSTDTMNGLSDVSPTAMNCTAPQNEVTNNEPGVSSSSSSSMSMVCRICYEGTKKEKLISPCKCMGTMGYLHRTCIEHWLGTSNSNKCEICDFEYITLRQPRPFSEWLCRPGRRSDRRNLVGDTSCFLLLTPLAAISAWLCASGAITYYENYGQGKWEALGLLMLAVFLILIYVIWCGVAVRYHYHVFSEWAEHNQVVRVVGLDQLSDVCINVEDEVGMENSESSPSDSLSEPPTNSDDNVISDSQSSSETISDRSAHVVDVNNNELSNSEDLSEQAAYATVEIEETNDGGKFSSPMNDGEHQTRNNVSIDSLDLD